MHVGHGRNRLYGQCGMSSPVFTDAEGAPPPLLPFLVSIFRKRRTPPEKRYTNDSLASKAPFSHGGAPISFIGALFRMQGAPMTARGAPIGFTGAPFPHAVAPLSHAGTPLLH